MLVQYVPHAYGLKGMNLPFAWWASWASTRLPADIMFHEVAFPGGAGRPWKHRLLARVTELMARIVAGRAERIFVSIEMWGRVLSRLAPGAPAAEWLPVPSTMPRDAPPGRAKAFRTTLGPSIRQVVGHFGTYGPFIVPYLRRAIPLLLARTDRAVVLIGRNGDRFAAELLAGRPDDWGGRLVATGDANPNDVTAWLAACDVILQPYPDGISGRRTSAMAAVAAGRPVVGTAGKLTEPAWLTAGAVLLVPADRPDELAPAVERLLADPAAARRLGDAARAFYREKFSIDHTIRLLRPGYLDPSRHPTGPTGCSRRTATPVAAC